MYAIQYLLPLLSSLSSWVATIVTGFCITVGGSANSTRVVFENTPVPASYLAANFGSKPAPSVAPIIAGLTKSITYGGSTFVINANTPNDIPSAGLYCPSNICNYTSVIGAYDTDTLVARWYYTYQNGGNPTKYNLSTPTVTYAYSATTDTFTATVNFYLSPSDPTSVRHFTMLTNTYGCPAGYQFNKLSSNCDLYDKTLAATSTKDGVCPVYAGVSDATDPDCQSLISTKLLIQAKAPDGSPVTTVADNTGALYTQKATVDATTGAIANETSVVIKNSDGSSARQDVNVASNGYVGPATQTNYSVPTPALYPGDPGSTVPGTDGGTVSSGSCGGAGQPACASTIQGWSDMTNQLQEILTQLSTNNTTLSDVSKSLSGLGTGIGSGIGTAMNSLGAKINAGQCGGNGEPVCTMTDLALEKAAAAIQAGQCGGPGQAPCVMTLDGADKPLTTPATDTSSLSLSGLFQPIQDKFAGFLNFQFPRHSASCPTINIDFAAWGLSVHESSTFMCDFLEAHRGLFGALESFGYIVLAIIILLGA